jgi:hypothetical protein
MYSYVRTFPRLHLLRLWTPKIFKFLFSACPSAGLVGDGVCHEEANTEACKFDGGDCGNEDYSPCSLCVFPFENDADPPVEFDTCTNDGPWGYLPMLSYCRDAENVWTLCGELDC